MGSSRNTTGGVSVPVGFRFHPTEEELVNHYLKKKRQDKNFEVDHIIPVKDICKHEPWDIPALLFPKPDSPNHDMEWFVFSPRLYKYNNSTRSKRTTPEGYWKITGKGRLIRARRSKAIIGKKRTLTFYKGRAPHSKKTNWVMHEYDNLIKSETIPDPKLAQSDFVLCRLKKNPDKKNTSVYAEGEPSSCYLSNCDGQAAAVVIPESQDNSSSALQSPASIELGDVLQATGTNDDCNDMQSPFGDNNYPVTGRNDISTCGEGEPYGFTMSDFENDDADNMFPELSAQPEENLDPPLQLHVTQQSPIYTKMGDLTHIDGINEECLQWPSQFGDNDSYITHKNNISTYDIEFVSSTASDFENQAAQNRILEQPCAQPHQPHDYRSSTLQAPIYTKMGSVLHADIYNDDGQSTFSDCDSYLSNDKNDISTNDNDDLVSNTTSNTENQATDESISEVCPQPEEDLESVFRSLEPEDYTLPPL